MNTIILVIREALMDVTVSSIVGSVACVGIGVMTGYFLALEPPRKQQLIKHHGANRSTSSEPQMKEVMPPLPKDIENLLDSAALCYLATINLSVHPDNCMSTEPHLSLMKFTYVGAPESLIIMTTRRDTQKLINLKNNPRVALLLHDFGETSREGTCSVTLYGRIRILQKGSTEEQTYRDIHLRRNSNYKQFIVGDDIAVLIVCVRSARICNIQDRVTHWSTGEEKRQ